MSEESMTREEIMQQRYEQFVGKGESVKGVNDRTEGGNGEEDTPGDGVAKPIPDDPVWKYIGETYKDESGSFEYPDFVYDENTTQAEKMLAAQEFLRERAPLSEKEEVDKFARKLLREAKNDNFELKSFLENYGGQTRAKSVDEMRAALIEAEKADLADDIKSGIITEDEIEERYSEDSLNKVDALKKYKELNKKSSSDEKPNYDHLTQVAKNKVDLIFKEKEKQFDAYLESLNPKSVMPGITLDDEKFNAFKSEFKEFVRPKVMQDESGRPIVYNDMQRVLNDMVANGHQQLVPFLWMALRGGIEGYDTKLRKSIAEEWEKKLSINPIEFGGSR